MPTFKPYQLGQFDYNECFFGEGGFLSPDSNEEKHMMALYIQTLAKELAKRNILFGTKSPLHWLEPGIGDASSTEKFIRALIELHPAGFIIHGSDLQADSLRIAKMNLDKLKDELRIGIAELRIADAFDDGLLAEAASCDFALLSHFIYHVKSKLDGTQQTETEITGKLENLLRSIMASLDVNGFALSFHEGDNSDMFGTFAKPFSYVMSDAPIRIARAAIKLDKAMVSTPLESKLYFPPITKDEIELLKDLANWKLYAEDTAQASWIKKILFALHIFSQTDSKGNNIKEGGAVSLAKEGKLPQVIDHLMSVLHQDDYGYYLVIRSEMQVVLNNPAMKLHFEAAFKAVEKKIPQIKEQVKALMWEERKPYFIKDESPKKTTRLA